MVLETENQPETKSTQYLLPRNHPDRIDVAFDDRRLVANAGLIQPATLGRRLVRPQLVDRHLDLGRAPGRANTGDKIMTLGPPPPAFAGAGSGWGRLHRRCRRVAHRRDGWRARLRSQGAIHPGHVPAQLPVEARPPAGSGERELLATVPGRLGPDPATRHSPSTWTPPAARPTVWPRQALDTTATPDSEAITRCWPRPGLWGRHRRRADVSVARGPGQPLFGRRPLPA